MCIRYTSYIGWRSIRLPISNYILIGEIETTTGSYVISSRHHETTKTTLTRQHVTWYLCPIGHFMFHFNITTLLSSLISICWHIWFRTIPFKPFITTHLEGAILKRNLIKHILLLIHLTKQITELCT